MSSTGVMGVYDFFKGQCPNCDKTIDDDPIYGKCGDIQTKFFITDPEECFRTFLPGDQVPFVPHKNLVIGRTCCCETIIKACFDGDRLTEYAVATGYEKYEYIRNEMYSSFDRTYIPEKDYDWFCHYQKTHNGNIEEKIAREASHPRKLAYYLGLGYSLDVICHE